MSFYDQLSAATLKERQHLLTAPIIADCLQGRVRIESYRAFLAQAYHHVRHTTPLLMLLGGRLPDRLGWLRKAVAEYIEEEIGHEEWILNDIAAAGGDAEAVRASRPELPAELMVAYAYDLVNRGNPAGFFGMVFVLEGTSVALALNAADKIQEALKSEQAEGISDKVLDGAADLANKLTGGKFADQIDGARDAADGAIGNE